MSTLLDKLEEDAYRNRSAMERRSGAWQRMLALSRAVHAGIEHDDLRLPAYGGNLFNPDEHPFLEARVPVEGEDGFEQLSVGVVDDFTVLTVLRHLQIANGQRISFRSLDVEQIGHVYEALLDHSAVLVTEQQVAVLGLIGKPGDEPEVSLVKLEGWTAKSDKELGKQLVGIGVAAEERGVYSAVEAGLAPDSEVAQTLNVAVANDQVLRERVEPYAPLLRADARGVALVFLPGDVYVTETSSKRDSGTAYTPRSLADEIAKHTLDPLIYDPGPQNEPDGSKWKLKGPEQMLDLKICDPAVGSAAILVAAVRYLAEALLQARVDAGELTPQALVSAAADTESVDVRIQARRAIVSHCAYGVDRDPMAVEMAKLSLWLTTMSRDEPFSFLDHAIRHGDSLLGVISMEQVEKLHLDPGRVSGAGKGQQLDLAGGDWADRVAEALNQSADARRRLRHLSDSSAADVAEKERLHRVAEDATARVRVVADAVVAACLASAAEKPEVADHKLAGLQPLIARLPESIVELRATAEKDLNAGRPPGAVSRSCLHWPLDFSDVFSNGRVGFDAILGNPPFLGGTKITEPMGVDFYRHIQRYIARAKTSRADLCAFFFRRAASLSRYIGFLATNSIRESDTHEHGLRALVPEWRVYRANAGRPWPGTASLHIAQVWMTRSPVSSQRMLAQGANWKAVPYLSSALTPRKSSDIIPYALKSHISLYFSGYKIDAQGFFVSEEEIQGILESDPASEALIFPVANGREALDGDFPRRVIDFGLRSEAEARRFPGAWEHVKAVVRDEVFGKGTSYDSWKVRWWQFWRPREDLRERLAAVDRVIVLPGTSKHGVPLIRPAGVVYTHAVNLIPEADLALFGLLHSEAHWWWVIERSSKMKSDIRYSPTDCLATFPFPESFQGIRQPSAELFANRTILEHKEGGITPAMNRVHDPTDLSPEVSAVREALQGVNAAVADAYGWPIAWAQLDFGDVEDRGLRFTVSEEAMNQILDAVAELNIERHAREAGMSRDAALLAALS
jgi:hypothetical protein